MRFHKVDGYEIVTRISGPDHHYLGLRFAEDAGPSSVEFTLEAVPLPGETRSREDRALTLKIAEEVHHGLNEANSRLGTDYELTGIRYCSSDRYVEGIYAELAGKVVEHVARSERGSQARV